MDNTLTCSVEGTCLDDPTGSYYYTMIHDYYYHTSTTPWRMVLLSWMRSYFQFHWPTTLLVSASTLGNTFLVLAVLYYWWANRQFHFRKRSKDGSRLSSLATRQDAVQLLLNARKKRQPSERQRLLLLRDDTAGGGGTSSDSEEEEEEKPVREEEELEEADLSDYDTDEDDDEESMDPAAVPQRTVDNNNKTRLDFVQQFPPSVRRSVKDLTLVVANMEVFSYLSQEAFVQCLEYMEYVDLVQHQTLFDQNSYDGSLYAVVTGQVKCQFEFIVTTHNHNNNNNNNNNSTQPPPPPPPGLASTGSSCSSTIDPDGADPAEPLISFTAGDGDVVTSLLSVLSGLVRQCQERSHPKNAESYQDGDNNNNNNNTVPLLPMPCCFTRIVPAGISVQAVGLAETTKLVRVPPQCFLAMMDTFPRDVHRIAQTIIARMQRVTLQTVVRTLGLQREIVQRSSSSLPAPNTASADGLPSNSSSMDESTREAWRRLREMLPSYLLPNAAAPNLQHQVNADAALVAANYLMGKTSGTDAQSNTDSLVQELQQVASIVALPPGQTLIETGEKLDAIYLVLHGSLDVGMSVPGTSAVLNQSTRRASVVQKDRRHIFPQGSNASSSGKIGGPPKPVPLSRRHSSSAKSARSSSNSHAAATTSNFSRIYKASMGEVLGTLSCFTGDNSTVTARNSSDWEPAILYKVSKDTYDALLAQHPSALTECLGSILDRLGSPIICLLDWNVEWMHVQAGEDVVHRGEECDAMYAILNGRLRAAVPFSGGDYQNRKATAAQPRSAPQNRRRRGILSRAAQKLRNRRGLLKFLKKSNPKVANSPPPLSRRMMNSAGEEVRGDEFGRGAIIGEVEILTGADWSYDVYASRHAELARVPVNVLNAIISMYPRAGLHLARVVASQIQRKDARKKNTSMVASKNAMNGTPSFHIERGSQPSTPTSAIAAPLPSIVGGNNILPSYGLNISTIAVVPLLDGDFDIGGFSNTLQQTLHSSIAPTKLMNKAFAREQLGEEVFRQRNAMHSLKLTRLCGDMEENYRLVVYQAEANYTWWTRLCIQQADCILLVVRAEEAPPQKKVEACLSWAFAALNVKIQLVVLQSPSHNENCEDDEEDEELYETMESSDQLNDWSEARYWVAGHHLVRMPFKKHVLDFRRMCRRITGRSVGIVLGGGGARGLAHIGVVRALMEAGVTVDFVGGTSQGAYIGALLAMQPDDFPALVAAARQMAASMSNNWEKLCDLTLPLVSFFSGYRFNRGIQKSLGRRRIQDLVCNFFCVSTDLRNNVQVVHTKGVCWRYVRASMTLQSYLPPLSEEGALLVDGGYMNVLPADVMKQQMRARTVIAVDVSQEVILDNYEYGSHLNGWWILWNSWNPFIKTVNIPSMGDISERLAWVSGERHKKKVKEHIDLFLQPPVGNFGVLEYDKFDEIVALGYEYAKPRVDHFVKKYPHLVS